MDEDMWDDDDVEQDHTKGYAFVTYAANEPRFKGNAFYVGSALEGMGFDVHYLAITNMQPGQLLNELRTWIGQNDGDDTVQLVLAFFGHSSVINGRLWACDNGPRDDFTALQVELRDHTLADALTILETCHAGTQLPTRLQGADARDTERFDGEARIVETLASCDNATTNSRPWVSRLVPELDVAVGNRPYRVLAIHQKIRRPGTKAPGLHRNELGSMETQSMKRLRW
ncbi:hypothetical protein LTR27_003459 [Elasticomyces elasticus]|nr:hypothetical protein LTR27_003459 [Elasticomyces elasticus]